MEPEKHLPDIRRKTNLPCIFKANLHFQLHFKIVKALSSFSTIKEMPSHTKHKLNELTGLKIFQQQNANWFVCLTSLTASPEIH